MDETIKLGIGITGYLETRESQEIIYNYTSDIQQLRILPLSKLSNTYRWAYVDRSRIITHEFREGESKILGVIVKTQLLYG